MNLNFNIKIKINSSLYYMNYLISLNKNIKYFYLVFLIHGLQPNFE